MKTEAQIEIQNKLKSMLGKLERQIKEIEKQLSKETKNEPARK